MLLHKIRVQYGIRGRFFEFVKSFLKDRTIQVKVNDTLSNKFHIHYGLPQGLAISPILFVLFINDVLMALGDTVQFGAFADDLALWKMCPRNILDQMKCRDELQRALNVINS